MRPMVGRRTGRRKPGTATPQCAPWPEPRPVPQGRPPVPPFSLAWVADIADRIQCPPDFIAVGAMVAAAAVIGRQIAIRPNGRMTGPWCPPSGGSRWARRGA